MDFRMCMSKAYLFFFFTLGGVKIFFSGHRECCVLKLAASPEQFAKALVVCSTFLEQIQDLKDINWMNVILRTSGLFAASRSPVLTASPSARGFRPQITVQPHLSLRSARVMSEATEGQGCGRQLCRRPPVGPTSWWSRPWVTLTSNE